MKDLIQIMAVFAVILTIIPTIVFLRPNESASKPAFSEKEKIAVYFTESGKTENFTLEEYMIGSVLAQMPADFEEESASRPRSYLHMPPTALRIPVAYSRLKRRTHQR